MSQLAFPIANTFGLAARCRQHLRVAAPCRFGVDEPALVVGEGSNLIPLCDFAGSVVQLADQQLSWQPQGDDWLVTAGGGCNWHQLVSELVTAGIGGLENLALIPGSVGAAPVQNIGAYGLEVGERIDWVEGFDRRDGQPFRLSASDCRFGYRDSLFKQADGQALVISRVQLRLPQAWQGRTSYAPLARLLDGKAVTPQQIFDAVCVIRRQKLPDWQQLGNAGSFFKNPLVSAEQAAQLAAAEPGLVSFAQGDGSVKLAAGWLIDRCGLKGLAVGGAAVHSEQALVLVNRSGTATARDLLQLALTVRERVQARFGVTLEPEVRFIAEQGEIGFDQALVRFLG
ncbi:MAG: UDP-N-acetylmuramate dehydrogenase [Gammaproteobacteria bacterium]|nr:UDP-N-acetylmuramate dehydrogenase [Gammaproteobacteria bacterium]